MTRARILLTSREDISFSCNRALSLKIIKNQNFAKLTVEVPNDIVTYVFITRLTDAVEDNAVLNARKIPNSA